MADHLRVKCLGCGQEYEYRTEQVVVEVSCSCGTQQVFATTHLRGKRIEAEPRNRAVFGLLQADWVGFYGSPDSSDEDVAIVYFHDIPEWVEKQWLAIHGSLVMVDPVVVEVKDGRVTKFLGANPDWPHPVEDVQNCLNRTVPELAQKIRYIMPADRDVAAKIAQCRAWLAYFDEAVQEDRYAANRWSKRAGFIGLQALALKWGQDAGYTKEAVRCWAKEHLKSPVRIGPAESVWLPPTDYPGFRESHDHQRVRKFLSWVVELPISYVLMRGPRLYNESRDTRDQAPYLVGDDSWWEPSTPFYPPPGYEEVKTKALGVCPLCQSALEYPDVYPQDDIYFRGTLVHPSCMERVQTGLTDLSDGQCHLEFDKEGIPYWVKGEYFSTSRAEYAVWDADWNLVSKTGGAADDPLGDFC